MNLVDPDPLEVFSWGGKSPEVEVKVWPHGMTASTPKYEWEEAIKEEANGALVLYTDGSRSEEDLVGCGWYSEGLGLGGRRRVGEKATGWDGEVAVIREGLQSHPLDDMLIFI